MLRRFRSWALSLASVCALVVSVVASAVEISAHVPHTGSASAPAYVEHDASAHRIEGTESKLPPSQPQCLVCQWFRSVSSHLTRVSRCTPPVNAVRRPIVDGFGAMSWALAAQPQLRGPPALI